MTSNQTIPIIFSALGVKNMKNLTLSHCPFALVALLFIAFSAKASAQQPSCGDTIMVDTTLNADLLACPGRGLRIGASNVTLDCNGHTIEAASNRVVEVNSGQSDVTVKSCVLISTADTDALRVAGNATNILITNNEIVTSGLSSRGIRLNETTQSVVSNNKVVTSGLNSDAIRLFKSSDNLVTDNKVVTSGETARGFRIGLGSSNNLVKNNMAHTTGDGGAGVLLRSGANGNTVTRNVLRIENSQTLRIESSSNNVIDDNTLISGHSWLRSRRFSLQNGGLSVHPDGLRVFAVENNLGGAQPNFGLGVTTTLIEADATTGRVLNTTRLTQGDVDLDFGFDALEILPSGRFIAHRGGGSGELYEIKPLSGEVIFIDRVPAINGLEARDEDNLIATDRDGNLWNIVIGPGPVFSTFRVASGPGWTDIAIGPSDVAYVISRHTAEDSGTNHLYRIDLDTGATTEIGDIGLAFISDIDFAADGTLYGNGGELLVIDAITAAVEGLGAFGEDPFEPPSLNNVLTKTTLVASDGNGSVHYPGMLTIPDGIAVEASMDDLNISFNRIFVDSGRLPFIDRKAIITLLGLPGEKRRLLIDEDDDGSFEKCRGNQCRLRLFKGGTLVFEVDGFTTYSSEERVKGRDDDDDNDN